MANIGKVIVGQQQKSTIVAQNFKAKPNVAVAELTDVVTTGVQDGYILTYSSALNKYVTSSANTVAANVSITNINGGIF